MGKARLFKAFVGFWKASTQGYAAWTSEQLQIELERGVWVHARAGFNRGGQEALRQLVLQAS